METRGKKILKLIVEDQAINTEREPTPGNVSDYTENNNYDKTVNIEELKLATGDVSPKVTILQDVILNYSTDIDQNNMPVEAFCAKHKIIQENLKKEDKSLLNNEDSISSGQSDIDDEFQDTDYIPETDSEISSCSSEEIKYNNKTEFVLPLKMSPLEEVDVNIVPNKKKRLWNKKDYCFYCEADVMKFSRHILRHHSLEIEVQEVMALRTGDKRRKHLFTKLRNKGNLLKNSVEEYIIPVRKPICDNEEERPNTSSYLPCKYCRGFYKKKYLFRHVKVCPHNTDDKKLRTNAQSDGQSLLTAYKRNDLLRNEIFPVMRADTISLAAKADLLICEVARRYLKSHRGKQYHLVASRKMRQLASLLLEMKKEGKAKNMLKALDPANFDSLVRCTKIIAKYDDETQTYGAPSLAANIGTLLKECVDVAYLMLIKKIGTKSDDLDKLKILKDLIISEWRYEVSTIANNDLQQKKWNKPSLIPLAEDLALLKTYLLSASNKSIEKLQQIPDDKKAFKELQEVTYVQLILLNRRRVGELQRMTVSLYINNIDNELSTEFDSCVSESEKVLMKSFKRVVIRGKRGRGVPVLFTEHMVKCTNLLVELRPRFVPKENIYLFANLKSLSSIIGSQVVYKIVRDAGVKNPTALTSTKLRKHLATMSQVINLSPQDLEQLASFMGHTSDIHKIYYRLPNDIYQTAKVSKLLLLSEKGQTSIFKGKALDEIDINLDIDEDNDENEELNEEFNAETNENFTEDGSQSGNNKSAEISRNIPKKQVKRVLEPWTSEQKKVTLDFFKHHIKSKTPPKKNECLQIKNENDEIFKNKSWEKIKIFVVNTYNKK